VYKSRGTYGQLHRDFHNIVRASVVHVKTKTPYLPFAYDLTKLARNAFTNVSSSFPLSLMSANRWHWQVGTVNYRDIWRFLRGPRPTELLAPPSTGPPRQVTHDTFLVLMTVLHRLDCVHVTVVRISEKLPAGSASPIVLSIILVRGIITYLALPLAWVAGRLHSLATPPACGGR
jgi:hypothetical protein